MATLVVQLVCMHKKCRPEANLQHNLCVKFAIKFSIGLEIAIPHENLGEANKAGKILLHRGAEP